MSDVPPQSGETERNQDVYCLNCEYNLRGLPGDPVRCPECGQTFDRDELDVSPLAVANRLSRLENIATFSAMLLGGGVLGLAIGASGVEKGMCCSATALVVGLPLWGIAAVQFKRLSADAVGWLGALLGFQVRTAAVFLAILLVALTVVEMASVSDPGYAVPIIIAAVVAACSCRAYFGKLGGFGRIARIATWKANRAARRPGHDADDNVSD